MTGTLYRNGMVRAAGVPAATAMLVDGAVVGWVGRDEAAPDATDVVDLQGALVTPAFVDAHVHATSTGLALVGLDLSATDSLAGALALLETHVRGHGGAAVLGHGWDETRWPDNRPPTRHELDRASYGGVVYLSRVDVHSAVVSSALLAAVPAARGLAGFDDSGWLRSDAHHAVRRAARETVSPGQRRDAQRATRRRAAEMGIGCLHELAGPEVSGTDDLLELMALARDEPGPEIIGYWGELGGIATATKLGAAGAAGDLFADGALGSRTASLCRPYTDDAGNSGAGYLSVAQVSDHVVASTQAGLQAGFHAIGDAALRTVLAGFSAAGDRVGTRALAAARHRIEHAEMLDAESIATMAQLGVVASVQPAFDAAWGGEDGMYAQRLGADRARGMNPLAALAAAGVRLAFGSDAPVTPLDPWAGVRAAVHHRTPASRLDAEAAFTAYTAGGWYAAGRDGEGVLEAGAPATFAVWETGSTAAGRSDAPGTDAGALPDLTLGRPLPNCRRTVVRGATIYEREGDR